MGKYIPHPRVRPSLTNRTQARKLLRYEKAINNAKRMLGQWLEGQQMRKQEVEEFIKFKT